jgi:hypothetical protein
LKTKSILILLVILAALTGTFYLVSRPRPGPAPDPKEYVWLIEQEDIEHITLTLPRENPPLSQKFIKISQEDKFPWFFDDPQRTPVDTQRWGGGIPLLLSGPGADRVINDNAPEDRLQAYGLLNPSLVVDLRLKDGRTITVTWGDRTPDGGNDYARAPNSNAVATVDRTWLDVISGLVKNPPFATTTTTPATTTRAN